MNSAHAIGGKSKLAWMLVFGMVVSQASRAQAPTPLKIPRVSIEASELGIVIAQGDPVSEALGTYYQSVRGIPEANVVRIPLTTGGEQITATQFAQLKSLVDGQLPSNVQVTLLTWTKPFRVVGSSCGMGITSAFAFGYNANFCSGDHITKSAYFDSASNKPWSDLKIRPSMMLGASTFEAGKKIIDRGRAAEATYPTGKGRLVTTTDSARSAPRAADFAAVPPRWALPGGLSMLHVNNAAGTASNLISNETDILFYFTGLTSVGLLNTNTYLPGAVGDHLTSFGGILTSTSGQMPATAWLDAGMTGSYGTVEEPFAYAPKFPQVSVMVDWYFRGATLIEAYWKSVEMPGQGLFLGDPLARPFPDVSSSSVGNGQYTFATRSLKQGDRYWVESRPTALADWSTMAGLSVPVHGLQTFVAPAPTSSVEARLIGPCKVSYGARIDSPMPQENVAQGGRAQNLYAQTTVYINDKVGCAQDLNLKAATLPNGSTVSFEPASVRLTGVDSAYVIAKISVPATVAVASDVSFAAPLQIQSRRQGIIEDSSQMNVRMKASSAPLSEEAPLLRIARPQADWYVADFPEAKMTLSYSIPVELDIEPGSGIVKVKIAFEPVELTDPQAVVATEYIEANTEEAQFRAEFIPQFIASGYYKLTATGLNAQGATVATKEIPLAVPGDFKTHLGGSANSSQDVMVGTTANDVFIGGFGADTLTGGGGKNLFVYRSMVDGNDVITDFKPGVDQIDLRPFLSRFGWTRFEARSKGVVVLTDTPGGLQVSLDHDGFAGPSLAKPIVLLKDVTLSMVDPVRDMGL